MFQKKIRVGKKLYGKLAQAAEALGCSSVEEFVERTREQEADRVLAEAGGAPSAAKTEAEKVAEKLKGLGYME